MKITFAEIRDKTVTVINRIGRRGTVVICSVILVGFAVLLNLILFDGEAGDKKSNLAIDPDTLTAGDPSMEGEEAASPVYNYFESMQLSRRQARDEAMEVLKSVADSATAVEEMKSDALDSIAQIARDIECEANIETLILAKGFAQCIAVVNGDAASIIVKTDGLLPSEIAQISEIVYEQAGILPTNLKIIEKDV